jgi:hypothetical protein
MMSFRMLLLFPVSVSEAFENGGTATFFPFLNGLSHDVNVDYIGSMMINK